MTRKAHYFCFALSTSTIPASYFNRSKFFRVFSGFTNLANSLSFRCCLICLYLPAYPSTCLCSLCRIYYIYFYIVFHFHFHFSLKSFSDMQSLRSSRRSAVRILAGLLCGCCCCCLFCCYLFFCCFHFYFLFGAVLLPLIWPALISVLMDGGFVVVVRRANFVCYL